MKRHVSIERMNDALDGQLTAAESADLERHLQECGACRDEYATLSETIVALRALPRDARAPEAVWAGIASRIEGTEPRAVEEGARVYRLPGAQRSRGAARFTLSQLAAASIAVAVVTAASVWALLGLGPDGAVVPTEVAGSPGGAAARAVSLEGDPYEDVARRLEEVLAEGRDLLTPETLVSIEQSLATIDGAMRDIEAALSEDPNSGLLMRMLATQQRTRLGVLRRAAAAIQAQT